MEPQLYSDSKVSLPPLHATNDELISQVGGRTPTISGSVVTVSKTDT